MPPRREEPLAEAAASDGIERARERALRFVAEEGDELALRRAQALAELAPVSRVVDSLERAEEARGSEGAAAGADAEAASEALSALADLGALRGAFVEIGRASCREGVETAGVD